MYEPIAARFIMLLSYSRQPMFVSIAFVNWLINEHTTRDVNKDRGVKAKAKATDPRQRPRMRK